MSESDGELLGSGAMAGAATAVLARRLTVLAREDERDSSEWRAIQSELASRRLKAVEPRPAMKSSLRAWLLQLLADSPGSTPSQLASQLGRSTTVVSRVLAILLAEDLIAYDVDADDLRVRHYRLSVNPGSEAGSQGSIPSPTIEEEERQYLALAISGAVRARRRENDLGYAQDRLGRALERAQEIRADDLALLARRELITTLRQAGDQPGVAALVEDLQKIEVGAAAIDAPLRLPAIGSLYYELGRDRSASVTKRLRHLDAAATAFSRCGQLPSAHDWCPREGWALLSTAEIWREQTEFGLARSLAEQAAQVFETYDDTYGRAEATRMQGFSLRLQGEFASAVKVLHEAERLARKSVSDRCVADVLLQLGDAYRCSGEFTRGWDHLQEAVEIAKRFGRRSTHGFSLSSQAAIRFEGGELDEALLLASEADALIAGVPAGKALNLRRWAVITRGLATEGDHALIGHARDLFWQSLGCYESLGSPAGVAACLVGLGRIPDTSDSGDIIERLAEVGSSSKGRLLLPMDPWVPSLLSQLADETDNAVVHKVACEAHCNDREFAKASEMAGEPRILSSFALAA